MELDIIYNEDCYSGIKKIPDKSIDLVYIDIPYLIESGGGKKTSQLAKNITKNYKTLSGDKSKLEKLHEKAKILKEKMDNAETKEEYEKWHCQHSGILNRINLCKADITSGIDYKLFDELARVMKNIYIYIWCSKEQINDIMNYWLSKPKVNFNLLVWCKTNSIPATNGCWLPNLEYCLVFKQEGTPKYNDGYEFKSKWYMSCANVKDKAKFEHPTIKPLEFVKNHILHSTKENDVVLDCFMGSGTTAVACKETGRHYIGFEISKEYVDIANDRLKGITKQDRERKERYFSLF